MIEPWSYLRCAAGDVHHLIGPAGGLLHTVVEYAPMALRGGATWRAVPNRPEIARLGLSVSAVELGRSNLQTRLRTSGPLAAQVSGLFECDVDEVFSPTDLTRQVLDGRVICPKGVLNDLSYLLSSMAGLGFNPDSFGLMGSIGFGLAHEGSDIDLMYYFSDSGEIGPLTARFLGASIPEITPFCRSAFGFASVYSARHRYMPISEAEMIFHESRKMTGFIERGQHDPRKFSIFPVRHGYNPMGWFSDSSLYTSNDVVTIEGLISDDRFAGVLGASALLVRNDLNQIAQEYPLVRIVDVMGNYTGFLRVDERVRVRGRLFTPSSQVDPAIILLDHWSDHIGGGYYAKSVF